jgi:hypothetical protein
MKTEQNNQHGAERKKIELDGKCQNKIEMSNTQITE